MAARKKTKRKIRKSGGDSGFTAFFKNRATEIFGFFILGFAVFAAAALLTYNPADPSFNHATDNPPTNLAGSAGAWLAGPTLELIGAAGFLLVIIPFIWGWKILRKDIPEKLWLRMVLFFVCIPAMAGAFALLDLLLHLENPISLPQDWPSDSFGGFIGKYLMESLSPSITIWAFGIAAVSSGIATMIISSGVGAGQWAGIFAGIWGMFTWAVLKIWDGMVYVAESVQQISERREVDDEEEEEDEKDIEFYGDFMMEDFEEEPARKDRESLLSKAFRAGRTEKPPKPEKPRRQPRKFRKTVETQPEPEQGELDVKMHDDFQMPPMDLLSPAKRKKSGGLSENALSQNAEMLEKVLEDFGVHGKIVEVSPGPVVTLYALEPSPGTKSARVVGLADDIARSMSAISARISVIPGRNAIGIELPNANRQTVYLRELLESREFQNSKAKLPLALGKDISGSDIIIDLAKTPHLLVAGTTGSGKSVGVNAMILSLIYRYAPDECKFIMIDPKMLELSMYQDIPHLLTPVVTDPAKAVVALKWTVKEMENRYRLMSNLGVRNLEGYNKKIAEAIENEEELTRTVQTGFDPDTGQPIMEDQPLDMSPLPFIVVIVDEMADLMLVAGKEIEGSIQRLAQMARAAGIHIVLATQRPSVDVITGIIKANFPSRISFQVTSKIDSRTILGEQGAEQLLGMGDMLCMTGGSRLVRVHGPFVDDIEVERVVEFAKSQGEPEYIEDVTVADDEEDGEFSVEGGEGRDEMYEKAVMVVQESGKASTSFIQRQLRIGYNRAANIIDELEQDGIISPADHAGRREVLVDG